MEDAQHLVEKLSDEVHRTSEKMGKLRVVMAERRAERIAELQKDITSLTTQRQRLEEMIKVIDKEVRSKEAVIASMEDDPDEDSDEEEMVEESGVSYAVLRRGDDVSTNAIVDVLGKSMEFQNLAKAATEALLHRDREDDEKLTKGIQLAVERGVLGDVLVEPVRKIDVTGRTADDVADDIYGQCNVQEKDDVVGRVVVLQGLSGTGKGTTVGKLLQRFDAAVSWSNGNVFRSVTLLALEHCRQNNVDLVDALTKENIAAWIASLKFDLFPEGYDIAVDGEGVSARVSRIANTLLKDPRIGRAIPTVASYTQGEVVLYAEACVQRMRLDGLSVIVEGRAPTLAYIRTPLRFELTIKDPNLLGARRLAQRLLGLTLDKLESQQGLDVNAALSASLTDLVNAATKAKAKADAAANS